MNSRRIAWSALFVLAVVLLIAGALRFYRRTAGTVTGGGKSMAVASATRAVDESVDDTTLPHGSIAGRVVDGAAKPVAGASVCASASSPRLVSSETRAPRCATADADGRYRLDDVLAANYELSGAAPHYRAARWRNPEIGKYGLELKPGEARANVDFVLLDGGVEVRGRVKDISGGPIVAAVVKVDSMGEYAAGDMAEVVARSDGQGAWSAWVAPGQVGVSAMAEGYADGYSHGIAPGQFIEVTLTPESVLEGRVVEAGTETPVAGAQVFAVSAGQSMQFAVSWGGDSSALTDAEGRFRIPHLQPGRFKPEARTAHHWGVSPESVLLGLGETSNELVIEVHPTAIVSGRIALPDGKGCAQAYIGLTENGPREMRNYHGGKTDEDGRVRIEELLPGTYEIDLNCQGAVSEEKYDPVVVSDKDISDLTWNVNPGRTVRGVVVDKAGEPVSPAIVFYDIKKGDGGPARSRPSGSTEKDGTFELRGLAAGTYEIKATRNGTDSSSDPVAVKVERDVDGVRLIMPLAPPTGTIEGTVVDSTGTPVSGVDVYTQARKRGGGSSSTIDNGTFVIKKVEPGDYRVWGGREKGMRAPGTGDDDPQGVPTTVRAGETAHVKLVVESQRGRIRGRVVDEGGIAVTDAFVDGERESESAGRAEGSARRNLSSGWHGSPVLTDMDGKFELTKLSPGTYTVRAFRKGGGESVVDKVRVDTEVTITIRQGGSISGVVTGSGVKSPDRFSVMVRDDKTGVAREEAFFRTGGAFALRDLPAGDFHVSAEASEGRAQTDIQLAQGQKREGVRLSLEPNTSVRGRLVTLDGAQPVSGMLVFVEPAVGSQRGFSYSSKEAQKHASDADGRFQIEDVPAGRVSVHVFPGFGGNGDYGYVLVPASLESARVNELPPLRVPRTRMHPGEVLADVGFTTQEMAPGADLEQTRWIVSAVGRNGPAAKAGLQPGDEIVSVDGQDVVGANGYLFRNLSQVAEGTRLNFGLRSGTSVVLQTEKRP